MMLFIYDALPVGGVETFFLRLFKERHKQGKKTLILLLSLPHKSDQELLKKIKCYAKVYFINDILLFYGNFAKWFLLLTPLKKKNCVKLMKDIDHIHVTNGVNAFFANKLIELVSKKIVMTVGMYHSLEFSWGKNSNLPFFERMNRKYLFNFLPKENIYLFSETMIEFYKKRIGVDLSKSQTFRLGVVDRNDKSTALNYSARKEKETRICSIGRLVDFKAYNLWMPEVINELIKDGISIKYDIYGDGPLHDDIQKKINELKLSRFIRLRGKLPYSEFDNIVQKYDLCIGSGTSIIQSSGLGVPSIIGIESIENPLTYGFFSECSHVDFNVVGNKLPLKSVAKLIKDFVTLSQAQKVEISQKHIDMVEPFYMDNCSNNFDDKSLTKFVKNKKFPLFKYSVSFFLTRVIFKITNKNFYKHTRTR